MTFWCGPGGGGEGKCSPGLHYRSNMVRLWDYRAFFFPPPPLFSAENSLQDSQWQTALLQAIQGCTCIWERLEIQRLLPLHPFILSYSFSSFFLSLSIPASWHTAVVAGRQHRLSPIRGECNRWFSKRLQRVYRSFEVVLCSCCLGRKFTNVVGKNKGYNQLNPYLWSENYQK